jgi:CRP-like cAMP-binding protein
MKLRTRPDVSPLAEVAPFDEVDAKELRPLLGHTDRLRLRSGTVLAHEGHLAHEFLTVVNGEVVASRAGEVIGIFGPGTQVGAAAVLAHGSHEATVVATTEVEVLVVNGPAYRWIAPSVDPARRTSGL